LRVSRDEVREAFEKSAAKRGDHQNPRQVPPSALLEQAKIASIHLTQSPEWNVFLQRIQALVDEERKLLNAMAESVAIPNMTSEQILQAQRHMLVARARIETWEQVIRLPSTLIEMGARKEPPQAA
jgi:hypothetical protein